MDMNTIRGLITLVVMLTFIGVWAWAWSSKRKRDFEAAANLPFRADLEDPDQEGNRQEGNDTGERK